MMSDTPKEEASYPYDVIIKCPECGWINAAQVHFYVGDPFLTYAHICHNCKYLISESEWSEL